LREASEGKKDRELGGFFGVCGDLWLVLGVLAAVSLNLPGSLAFVGSCGELWTELGFDGCGFGVWPCFLGLKSADSARKRAVERGEMCG
jgi:hypothetical protein